MPPTGEGKGPKLLSYNGFKIGDKPEGRPRPQVAPNTVTLRALEELGWITTLAEFVEVCAEQRRRRKG